MARTIISIAVVASLTASCGDVGPSGGGAEPLGTATIAITNAPPDGTCIQIAAEGARSVTKSFDVMAGSSTVLSMSGLPLGHVTFTAAAFGSSCAGVAASGMMAPSPNWVSTAPATANVLVKPPVAVTLVMVRNGTASVAVDFTQDDSGVGSGCATAGGSCSAMVPCCSPGTCDPAALVCVFPCTSSGQACTKNSDCCSMVCASPAPGMMSGVCQ